jgi:hypothetical protein
MIIAKIVKSNSHIDYVARVIDTLDTATPPGPEDYGFGQFVILPVSETQSMIGVIYNSLLVNPEYSNFGPRLSPAPELRSFSPDYLNEQGQLVGILLVGMRENGKKTLHGVPRRVVRPDQEVRKMPPDQVVEFHTDERGSLQIHYYSQIITHAGPFAVPLIESIVEQLSENAAEDDRNRLNVLKKALAWQRTVGGMRL